MPLPRSVRLRLAWPALRLGWHYVEDRDSWRSLPHDVPMLVYGEGNLADDFRWYVQGPSRVSVTSVADICEWLRTCEYVRDPTLFGRADYWQHPTGFEELRRGDCEDHALWAWRKLIELGYHTELLVGRCHSHDSENDSFHAWVVYREGQSRYLLETVTKTDDPMCVLLDRVSQQYHPHASVDHHFQRHLYAGFFAWYEALLQRRREAKEASKRVAS